MKIKSVYLLLFILFPAIGFSQAALSPASKIFFDPIAGDIKDRIFPAADNIHALIQVDLAAVREEAFEQTGISIQTRAGNIWSVSCSSANAANLVNIPGVLYIDLAGKLNAAWAKNDTSAILSKADLVWNGINNGLVKNYTGKNVVVGIVDVGFQTDHPTFYDTLGGILRIKRFWNQPTKAPPTPAGFNYGRECKTDAEITAEKDDDGTHGTHVAGIAAGSGFGSPGFRFRGMAPESDIVMVNIRYYNDQTPGSALGDYLVANPAIIDAFSYVFNYAKSVSKPAVCNLSWGMHTGPHDGSSLFDIAVDNLCGPGKIVAGANGNDGGSRMHVLANLNRDTAYTFAWDNNRNDRRTEEVYADFWGSKDSSFAISVSLLDTFGNVLLSSPFISSQSDKITIATYGNGTDTLKVTLTCQKKYLNNNRPNILAMIEQNNTGKNRIRIGFTGGGQVHGWNSGAIYRWTGGTFGDQVRGNDYRGKYLNGDNKNTVGENGGSGKSTISSGAYVARKSFLNSKGKWITDGGITPLDLAPFSSRGTTLDGRIKPDVTSPGVNIISSVHRRTLPGWMQDRVVLKTAFRGDTNYYVPLSGTSMASPHTCGVIALMLEANPTLTPQQAKSIIQNTAYSDNFTGSSLPDNSWGYGKLNALEAVKEANRILGMNPQWIEAGIYVYPNPAGNSCMVKWDPQLSVTAIELMDTRGCLISKKAITEGNIQPMDLSSVSPGIYFVRLETSQGIFSRILTKE